MHTIKAELFSSSKMVPKKILNLINFSQIGRRFPIVTVMMKAKTVKKVT